MAETSTDPIHQITVAIGSLAALRCDFVELDDEAIAERIDRLTQQFVEIRDLVSLEVYVAEKDDGTR